MDAFSSANIITEGLETVPFDIVYVVAENTDDYCIPLQALIQFLNAVKQYQLDLSTDSFDIVYNIAKKYRNALYLSEPEDRYIFISNYRYNFYSLVIGADGAIISAYIYDNDIIYKFATIHGPELDIKNICKGDALIKSNYSYRSRLLPYVPGIKHPYLTKQVISGLKSYIYDFCGDEERDIQYTDLQRFLKGLLSYNV